MQRSLMAPRHAQPDHRAMENSPSSPASWWRRARRWTDRLGARHGRSALVVLALGMAVVLLLSYVEVLQDQIARASSAQQVARAGAATPLDSGVAGAGTEGTRAVRNHMR